MIHRARSLPHFRIPASAVFLLSFLAVVDADCQTVDYLSFAQGAVPVELGGMAEELNASFDQALKAIDGDPGGYTLTPKPGGPATELFMVYELPAPTTFTEFAVPNILETPSPSQTFFKSIVIAGSSQGPSGPFQTLATATLSTHGKKGESTKIVASARKSATWVKVTLQGGIDVQREKTFFEFSELIGYGTQERVPLLDKFSGKWTGRGIVLELKQDGVSVSGCYDRAGDLAGTVTGNILRATGKNRNSGVPSTFVLTVTGTGQLSGVRSTNGAPFRLQAAESSPTASTGCSLTSARPPGCGSLVHGIQFAYDSAEIRPESNAILDALFSGLKSAPDSSIAIIGHTSSEGSNEYNQNLSQSRAEAVVAALIARGLAASRLSARGAGETQPIAENTTEAGRSLNRRVEVLCAGQ